MRYRCDFNRRGFNNRLKAQGTRRKAAPHTTSAKQQNTIDVELATSALSLKPAAWSLMPAA
jgi:hypothetical protein